MRFHVVNIEPAGFRLGHFLDYYCRLICYGLESLGHDCSIGCNQLDSGRVNILLGAHLLTSADDVESVMTGGAYIVAQSEIIRPDGVNRLGNGETMREVYFPLLMGAQAVWEAIPGNLPVLQQMGVRALQATAGYHPRLEEVVHKRNKDIDFAFFGSTTPHRAQLLTALRRRGYQLAILGDARQIYRNDVIARSKVNLSPNQGAEMNHLPYGRICYLLNNRALVAVEECRDQQWLAHCFSAAPTDEWIDLCVDLLLRKDRDQLNETYYERYRELLFTRQLEQLLEATFSNTSASQETPHSRRRTDVGETIVTCDREVV